MEQCPLRIQMLGEFVLSAGNKTIRDNDNRSRKVWLLLAYIIYFRNRRISKEELIERFWVDEDGSTDPVNALKAVIYRVRTTLDGLGKSMGKSLINCTKGNYKWNTDADFVIDIDEFERLYRLFSTEKDEERELQYGLQAVSIYRGDFLAKFSNESWILPINAYYHRIYLQIVQRCLELLSARERAGEIAELSRRAIEIEPCDERLYYYLMRALMDMGDPQGVRSVYDSMSTELFSRLGIMPSDEIRLLYREAMRTSNEMETDLSSILEDLREAEEDDGAYLCEYDFFKALYHVKARSVIRSGDTVHMCLISVSGGKVNPLPKRSLSLCMKNLCGIITSSLRKGDMVTKCSPSQYLIMLPQANYENSCAIMERMVKTFVRRYPHSPAELRYMVQPLEHAD